jgi:hypothetical protein
LQKTPSNLLNTKLGSRNKIGGNTQSRRGVPSTSKKDKVRDQRKQQKSQIINNDKSNNLGFTNAVNDLEDSVISKNFKLPL